MTFLQLIGGVSFVLLCCVVGVFLVRLACEAPWRRERRSPRRRWEDE